MALHTQDHGSWVELMGMVSSKSWMAQCMKAFGLTTEPSVRVSSSTPQRKQSMSVTLSEIRRKALANREMKKGLTEVISREEITMDQDK